MFYITGTDLFIYGLYVITGYFIYVLYNLVNCNRFSAGNIYGLTGGFFGLGGEQVCSYDIFNI